MKGGIADPVTHPGQVYKSTDNVDLTVNEDGSIKEKYTGGFKGRKWKWTKEQGARVRPGKEASGWKPKAWRDDYLHKKLNDTGWDKLFEKAEPNK